MPQDMNYDQLRDLLEGRLSAEEEALLRRELAEDPVRAEEAVRYEQVFDATRPLDDPDAVSILAFEDLPVGAPPARLWRIGLAAAAILVLGLATALLFGRSPRGPEPFVVSQVPVNEPALEADDPRALEAPLVPNELAAYRPTDGERVRWLDDAATAQTLARLSGRPVLRYRAHPTCPLCLRMESGTLADARVREHIQDTVPLREVVTGITAEAFTELVAGGWPRFQIETPEAVVFAEFHGMRDASAFTAELESARQHVTGAEDPVPWESLALWLQEIEGVRSLIAGDRPGEAWATLAKARALATRSTLSEHEDALERLLTHAAWDALEGARASTDPVRALGEAARRFEGSPFAREFEALAAHVSATGSFPPLEEAAP